MPRVAQPAEGLAQKIGGQSFPATFTSNLQIQHAGRRGAPTSGKRLDVPEIDRRQRLAAGCGFEVKS